MGRKMTVGSGFAGAGAALGGSAGFSAAGGALNAVSRLLKSFEKNPPDFPFSSDMRGSLPAAFLSGHPPFSAIGEKISAFP
ncbi:MAG: hypothetical protein IOB85_02160 [Methylobacterium sp.]|nr:hypothetical protein [Methylobacterium sp.]MCA3679730.1 hypothetical protein [Methylobacterium sp.]MCA3682572.1 hypothetical protein [Methylobacterium sp.]MCA3688363.1 hypothetical protein [Methylobacterium sp.]MCA3690792.1 hypothetical protein [Methylobacterium sp.]